MHLVSFYYKKHLHMKKIIMSFCIKIVYKHIYWPQQVSL